MDLIRNDSASPIPSGKSLISSIAWAFRSDQACLLYICVCIRSTIAHLFACSHPFVRFTAQPRLSSNVCSVSTGHATTAKDGVRQRHDLIRSLTLTSSGSEYPSWVPVALWCPAVAARSTASSRARTVVPGHQSAYSFVFSRILRFCTHHSITLSALLLPPCVIIIV